MTNKFKFRDNVWHKEHGLGVIYAKSKGENTWAAFADGAIKEYSDIELNSPNGCEITLVPDLIPVTERMPELGVPVLVIGGSTAWVDKAYDSDDGVSFYDDNYGIATHWMPLPAPPVEVEQ